MTATDQSQSQACENCSKFGLPILPVRYAVARSDDAVTRKAPELEGPFGEGVQSIGLPEAATYTLRLLRSGYLYVFNESSGAWMAYQVDNYGDLTEFDIRDPAPPPQEDGPQAVCSQHGVPSLARCIVVPDAKQATTLWLAFSGAPWTPAVIASHRQEAYRQRHMRRIDLGAWVATSSEQPHLANLYQAMDQVSEFKLASEYRPYAGDQAGIRTMATVTVTPGSLPFEHSLSDCISLDRNRVDDLSAKARACARQTTPDHPQGVTPALVALDDPIGIAADLNQLALERIAEWEQDTERTEKKASASAIVSLREAIKNGALEEEQAQRRDGALLRHAIIGVLGGRTARDQLSLPVQDWDDDWFKVEDEETILRLGEESWNKYRKHLKNENAYETWLTETYPAEQARFYQSRVQSLDEALVQWLQAPLLQEHLTCNFDPADIDSGIQYQEAAAVVLQDAASRSVMFNYIAACLKEQDPREAGAFLLRAQVWNQDEAVAAWVSAAEAGSDGGSSGWRKTTSDLYNTFRGLLDAHGDGKLTGALGNLAKYTEQLAGPLTSLVGEYVSGLATGAATLMPHKMQIGLLGALVKVDDPLMEIIDLVGHVSPQNASRALAATIAAQAGLPDRVSAGRPAREVLRAGGAPTSGPGGVRFGYVVLANADQVRLMNALNIRAISPGDSYRNALPQHYRTHQFHALLRQSVGQLGNRSLGYGVVGLILAGGSLGELSKEYKKAAPGVRGLKAANFGAGVVGLLGGIAEMVGTAGNRWPWFSQKLSKPNRWWLRNATTRAQLIAGVGRWLTGIGGVVMGALMVVEGWKETSLSMGYGVTVAGLGVVSALAAGMILFGVLVPAAIVLLIITAIVTIVVAWFKPDEIQRWLDKAMHFGNNASGVYSDLEAQGEAMKSLQQAR